MNKADSKTETIILNGEPVEVKKKDLKVIIEGGRNCGRRFSLSEVKAVMLDKALGYIR
jgi:hypothetical protein